MAKTARKTYGNYREYGIVDKLIARDAMTGKNELYLPMVERPGGKYEVGPLYMDNDRNPYYVDAKGLGDYLREDGYLFNAFDKESWPEPMVLITWEY